MAWCTYPVQGLGFCSRHVIGGDRCPKHLGLKPHPKIEKKEKHNRGDSKWQKDNEMFGNK